MEAPRPSSPVHKVGSFDIYLTWFLVELDAMLNFVPGWLPLTEGFDAQIFPRPSLGTAQLSVFLHPNNWPTGTGMTLHLQMHTGRWAITEGMLLAEHMAFEDVPLNFPFQVSHIDRRVMEIRINAGPGLERLTGAIGRHYVSSKQVFTRRAAGTNSTHGYVH